MIDPSLVQSGFDSETLLNRRYIRYLLMNSIETGSLPMQFSLEVEVFGAPATVTVDLYAPDDYVRNYTPDAAAPAPVNTSPDAFDVEILFDDPLEADLRIRLVADVSGLILPFTGEVIDLFASFDLLTDPAEDGSGNQTNARLQLTTIDVQGNLIDIILGTGEVTREELVALIGEQVNREVPLSMVGAGSVQSIAMKKLAGADSDTHVLAMYLNLVLKNGPAEDDIRPERGLVDSGINFLPDGHDLAFGMPSGIYDRLSVDAFQRTAYEIPEDSGSFSHPILEDPNDVTSKQLGRIDSVTIRPKLESGVFTNELLITVAGELFWDVEVFGIDIAPDPNFTLFITITPELNNGIITWTMTYDMDFDPLLKFLINLIIGSIMALLFVPTMGWGSLAVGALAFSLLYVLEDEVVEPMIATAIGESNDSFDTSVLESIPNRLTIETRRWDPFYYTDHMIVAATDGMMISDAGLGFSGSALLDKAARFVTHIVARTEDKDDAGKLTGLQYRVKDHRNESNDFVNHFLGTDREAFAQVTDDDETNLYALTKDQILGRIETGKLIPRILYYAQKVHIENNQVSEIAAISNQEMNEIIDRLTDDFEEAKEAEIRADQETTLRETAVEELEAELGTTPSDEEVEDRLQLLVDKLVDEALIDYLDEQLDADLEAAIDETIRLDIPPNEMAELQGKKVLMLSRFDIVYRQGKPYYRDRADGYIPDNLMELPKFIKDED